jgi:hypothetical protein
MAATAQDSSAPLRAGEKKEEDTEDGKMDLSPSWLFAIFTDRSCNNHVASNAVVVSTDIRDHLEGAIWHTLTYITHHTLAYIHH